ncbi:glutaredoxin family protein [Arthrobacter sp. zg-Y820]|uniref:glutaredoxin family protein n=1 Tax=unclassified Arthrobacter TaxID=235627 RepID=UPI001E3CB898|nr:MULTISPECIES: glutaredoxin family protein [unclassified Arthrobacter]MCC9195593.1 glutaredoxin family protein [Arthrobacter sp. zg-Y820]MDK1278452.1 glutaredoxin family protein [Arthrobacter sp. zg.Y820]WIB09109.1 glutaredoxin family protein [Arthrobacter sp. zg-Y820]
MTSSDTSPDLLLLTRPGCHLCEAARAVLERIRADLAISWREQSIEGDAELTSRFGEEIPVLLIDGVQRDFWQLDEARIRRLLGA